jgi:hypothetical protein
MPGTHKQTLLRRLALRVGLPLLGVLVLVAGALVVSTRGLSTFGGKPDPARLVSLALASRYEDGHFTNLEAPFPLVAADERTTLSSRSQRLRGQLLG